MDFDLQYHLFCCFIRAPEHYFWRSFGDGAEYAGAWHGCVPDDFLFADSCSTCCIGNLMDLAVKSTIRVGQRCSRLVSHTRAALAWQHILVKPALILMSLWGIGQAVIIYLAGLSDISQEYYEAAEVDGASFLQKTFYITLPLLTPVIFFNLVMGFIGAFQQFTLPYTMTQGSGSPADSLTFYVMYLYDNAFSYFRMGYASAMAWILFVIIMALTAIVFWSSKRWVHYQGD